VLEISSFELKSTKNKFLNQKQKGFSDVIVCKDVNIESD